VNLGIDGVVKSCDPDKVIFNFSSVQLSPRIRTLLAFGLDFCLPVFKLDFHRYFLAFEKLVYNVKSLNCQDLPEFTEKLKIVANRYYYNFKPFKIFSAIATKQDLVELRKFASNRNIIVSRPDKGRGVVIIDKVRYLTSMTSLISDRTKFIEILDPIQKFTLRVEDKINNFLRKVKALKLITDDVYSQLFVSGSGPGILYGLPKVHKANFNTAFPFRPIFSACNTPSFNLAKFLVPILSPHTQNQYTTENSHMFSNEISTIKNANTLFMASFDVENLFTNIPVRETIDICLGLLFTNPGATIIGLSKTLFKNLLELSVLNSFFMFNGKFYQQCEGLGMGLPLGPTFANIFMCFHETIWLNDCPISFKPVFYKRYIDDTFLLFRCQSHVSLFLNYLNSKHTNIKFTMEPEVENKLSFLDCLVHRDGNSFKCSVFRKSSFSGLGLSFYSFCTSRFKINSVKTLLSRAFRVCSSYVFLHDEFVFLKEFFRNNGYSSFLIDKLISNILSKRYDPPSITFGPSLRKIYLSFPYFGHQSERMKIDIQRLLSEYFIGIEFNIILVNKFTIGSFFNYKDRLPLASRSSLVYSFSCAQCASSYVGMTARALFTRVAEHAGRSFRTGRPLAQPPHSSVRLHTEQCSLAPPVSINQFKILCNASSQTDLRILESLYIHKLKPKLNNQSSSFPLSILGQ
jgi:hypothetical protein